MATMVSTRPVIQKGAGGSPGMPGPNGNGSKRGGPFREPDSKANRYRIGMWVGLASIAMMFTSLSSAYIVRSGTAADWLPLRLPRVMFVSTALILISSVTIEVARRKLKQSFSEAYSRYLLLTGLLGLAFLSSQVIAWRQLASQGIYVSSHPHSSFFYLLTGAHGVHIAGGLLALGFLWLRSLRKSEEPYFVAKRQATADAVSIYWHFMDGLWIYLFLLLLLWR
ncbi:MAG TPA: cytochrome c oxidase subunit 3 [Pyrinomonadaceae bacterium]|nr:cytochrome c oxidase subunit 3 [Pyrinomonadaceae bacterium]